jgi:hypothetical protein
MQRFSLLGIVKHANAIDRRFYERARKRHVDFRTRKCPEVAIVPGLRFFPTPVQMLMAGELHEGQRLLDDGEPFREALLQYLKLDEDVDDEGEVAEWVELPYNVKCDCHFYRRWRLPCRHLFHHHFTTESLSERHFQEWSHVWEDHGFELYESTESFRDFPKQAVEPVAMTERLKAREVIEELTSLYYELESSALTQLGEDEGRLFINWYIKRLQQAATWLGTMDYNAWKEKLC